MSWRGAPRMRTLVIYPHGLGDCILATPALRAYKRQTGAFVAFATLERFRSAELFRHSPYVDELLYTRDAWNEFPSFGEGCRAIEEECRKLHGSRYDEVVVIKHSPDGSKILDCARALGVALHDPHTAVYISEGDWAAADAFVRDLGRFGFVHAETGVSSKDLPPGYGARWLRTHCGLDHVVEVGKTFGVSEFNVNVQFAIMARAAAVCLTDSVFYHACGAMDKDVDLVYFARGRAVYERVRPLHPVRQNVVCSLPTV